MSDWDHFYTGGAFQEGVSPYYVGLPSSVCVESKPDRSLNSSHKSLRPFYILKIKNDTGHQNYARNYEQWICDNIGLGGGL